MELNQIKQYLNQQYKLDFEANVLTCLNELKAEAVAQDNETLANEIWCLE